MITCFSVEQLSRSGCPRGRGHCYRLSEFVGDFWWTVIDMDILLGSSLSVFGEFVGEICVTRDRLSIVLQFRF